MAEKRRDKKGRLLKEGEYQRSDGRYEFKYEDISQERKSVYSWRLTETDPLPAGKKPDKSLREKEKEIQKQLEEGVITGTVKTTLNEQFDIYMKIRHFADSTEQNYRYMWNRFVRDSLGKHMVKNIKRSDILVFYSKNKKKGIADGTIQIFYKMIHPALQLAVEDHIIKENPSDGCCGEYTGQSHEKNALTKEEERIFWDCLQKFHSRQRYDLLFRVMLGTACKIGEITGLTWDNIDMTARTVTVDHVLLYRKKDGITQFYAKETKTKKGVRIIPMTEDVYKAFCELQEERMQRPSTVIIDGYKDFVFTSMKGKPLYPANINKALYNLVEKYNKDTGKTLPKISNHIFRHTGCTRMAEAEIDINTLQYVMGHENPKMILKVYDHVNLERVQKQMKKLDSSKDIA